MLPVAVLIWPMAQGAANAKHRSAQAVHGVAEAEILPHLQLREADVDAVEEGDDVADEQEWNDAPRHLAVKRVVGSMIVPWLIRGSPPGRHCAHRSAGTGAAIAPSGTGSNSGCFMKNFTQTAAVTPNTVRTLPL